MWDMPLHMTPGDAMPAASTASVRITRSGCLDEAAILLDALYRRVDEARAKRTAPAEDEGRSPAAGGKFAGSSTATEKGRAASGATNRKVPAA